MISDQIFKDFEDVFGEKADLDTFVLFFERVRERGQLGQEIKKFFIKAGQHLDKIEGGEGLRFSRVFWGIILFLMSKQDDLENDVVKQIERVIQRIVDILKKVKNQGMEIKGRMIDDFFYVYQSFKTFQPLQKSLCLSLNLIRIILEEKGITQKIKTPSEIFSLAFDEISYFAEKQKVLFSKKNTRIISILIKICRNLIFQKVSLKKKNFINDILEILNQYTSNDEIVKDLLRILIKISEHPTLTKKITNNSNLLNLLLNIYDTHYKNEYVLNAYLQLIGNLLASSPIFASEIYKSEHMPRLLSLFALFTEKRTSQIPQQDQMLQSFANFEFLEQNDCELVAKLLRSFANIFTIEENSTHFLQNNFSEYKNTLKALKLFLIEGEARSASLLLAALAFLTNIFYFENSIILYNDFELQKLKLDVVKQIAFLILSPENEGALIEGLRAIANLTKSKKIASYLIELNYSSALCALLQYNDEEVIFNSLGCLINLSNNDSFYENNYFQELLENIGKIEIQTEKILTLAAQACFNTLHSLKNKQKYHLSQQSLLNLQALISQCLQYPPLQSLTTTLQNYFQLFKPLPSEKPKKFLLKKRGSALCKQLYNMQSNSDPFSDESFDPIAYINSKFRDEASLSTLNSEIDSIKQQITLLDQEILTDIHQHAVLNKKTKEELSDTHALTQQLVSEIKQIKDKSLESEKIVQEMCKDIKTLDQAKRNITQSINCLGKFSDLIVSLDNLRACSNSKSYREAAQVLSSVLDLAQYFQPYKDIPQIKEVLDNEQRVLQNLRLQINDEFSLLFKEMSSESEETLKGACAVVEALGPDFRKEIIAMAVRVVLTPYQELYERKESKTLESIEKRFVWFARALADFKSRYASIFPHKWGILCFIVNEFCGETSVHVSEILPAVEPREENIVPLIKALQSSINFENAMEKELKQEYGQYTEVGQGGPHQITQIPRVRGTISKCFESYTGPYVEREEKELREVVFQELEKDLAKKEKFTPSSEELNIFPSSLLLFKKIKFLLERVSKLSRGKTMTDVYKSIKKNVQRYLEALQAQVTREELAIRKEDERRFLLNLCALINTADYAKETVAKMNDVIQSLVEEPYNHDLDFSSEEDLCARVSIDAINAALKLYLSKLDVILSQKMQKISFDKLTNQLTVSEYVQEIKLLLDFFASSLRRNVNNVYLVRAFKLISENTNSKFIEQVFRMKKITDAAAKRLRLDFGEIKQSLISLGMVDGESISNIYATVCESQCRKSEAMLKILEADDEQVEMVVSEWASTLANSEISKLLYLRGMKKNEVNSLLAKFGK